MSKAIVIQPDGTFEHEDIADDLATLQAHVGGYVETVTSPFHPGVVALVNEDGLMRGLADNPTASAIILRSLVGPVVLVGAVTGGKFTDVPAYVLPWLEA